MSKSKTATFLFPIAALAALLLSVTSATGAVQPIVAEGPAPTQPPGREPMARHPAAKRRRSRSARGGPKPAPR